MSPHPGNGSIFACRRVARRWRSRSSRFFEPQTVSATQKNVAEAPGGQSPAGGVSRVRKKGRGAEPMPCQDPPVVKLTHPLRWIGIGLAMILAVGCAGMPLRPASSSSGDAQGGTQVGGLLDLERAARSATLVQAVPSAQWSSGLLPPEGGDMLEVKTPDVDRKAVGFIGERVQLGPDGKPVRSGKPLTMRLPWAQLERVRSGFDLRDQYVDLIKTEGDAIRIYFPDQFARDRFQTALEALLPDLRAKNLSQAR